MNIHGFNKLTLLDYPEHMACTVFTGHCNFRCPFCHNASLVLNPSAQPLISTEAVIQTLESRVGILEGICITGGEPTIQNDLPDFIARIKHLGFLVKLDTNGSKPDIIKELIANKLLDYIAMDIKTSPENYCKLIGLSEAPVPAVMQTTALIMNSGIDYEFRTTVVGELHGEKDFSDIAQWLSGAKRYYLQSFEDSGDLITNGLHAADREQMLKYRDILKKTIKKAELRG